jgi:cell fate regulator YaaT (PSP1 superfamily)
MSRIAAVRYGAMDNVAYFEVQQEGLHEGDEVIVRTDRGLEWGEMVSQVRQSTSGAEARAPEPAGQLLRRASEQDQGKHREIIDRLEKEELECCNGLIEKYHLPMKLLSVEHLFGGNKLIFFFSAEGRVDFRALVKELAKRYRTRIEMRQIGVRDEAKLLGRLGPCGRVLCCRVFLKCLKPIPMKIAKSQKSTLDPAKISGRCGRLKCCLNFEDEVYTELKKTLPRRGTNVQTPSGPGVVVGQEIIEQKVVVRLEEGAQMKFPVAEITRGKAKSGGGQ